MIHVIKSGMLTSLQDAGRCGYQHLGIPVSGAMDIQSLRMANILLGNQETEAALECTLLGPDIEFEEDCLFSIAGADMKPHLNQKELKLYHVYLGKKGDVLKLDFAVSGVRSYIAFAGGFRIEPVLGSASTDLRCRFGGYKGRKLQTGDRLELKSPKQTLPNMYKRFEDFEIHSEDETVIRVMTGPQDDYFTSKGKNTFFSGPYRIMQESDRMGYRLEGKAIEYADGVDIVSDGITFGSIQVTAAGLPIIMMADHQTTGGYAKIATVISSDLPLLAQMKPGQKIRFEPVTLKAARKFWHRQEKDIRRFRRHTN